MNLTFLNAAFLFGALAALLPLIIHLFSRRRVETVDFSSLRFLRELERRKIRRVRIRQVLLLIVRSLIILCVALALARPTLSGALAVGSGRARTSVAIVLDQSASMSRRGATGALIDEAVDVGLRIAGLLDEGDQGFLVTAGSPPRSVLGGGTSSRGTLSEAIEEIEPTAAATDYSGAVRVALELLDGARNLNRELYVVGDMQRSGWSDPESGDGAPGYEDARGATPDDDPSHGGTSPTAYVFTLDGPTGNVSVTDVRTERKYGGTAGLFSVTARVENGSRRAAEIPVRLFVDGVQVGRAGVDLAIGEHGGVTFSVAVDDAIWHSGWVELPSDALDADNRAYFVIPPTRTTEVLVVEPDAASERDDAYYAVRALDPSGDGGRFKPLVVPLSSLRAQRQDRFPAVVLADVGRMDGDATVWLERHVTGGGGLVLIFGDRTDVRAWNDGEVPGSSSVRLIEPFERSGGVRVAPSGHGHPLVDGLVFGERLVDEIFVRRGFVADVTDGEVILELPGIGPGLVATGGGTGESAGEVVVLLTSLDTQWSNLPRSGFLVPLLHRVVDQVSGRSSRRVDALVGDDLVLRLPDGSAGRVDVTLPDGSVATPEHRSGVRPSVVLKGAVTPGIHMFQRGDEIVGLRAVNVSPAESDLEQAAPSEIGRHLVGLRHVFMDAGDDIAQGILEARRGREIWRVLVYAAVALLALEMYLARSRTS